MTDDIVLPVQLQLAAYNAKDIDAFMQCWAEGCAYYAFPDRLLATGLSEVRARHVERFREPNLHGRLIKRMAAAGLVVDQEVVTRVFGEVDVIAIYEVAGGKIVRAWFKMGGRRLHAIRTAGVADVDAIRVLVREAYAKWVPLIGREPKPMQADYAAAVAGHRIDLLEVDGVLAGLIEMVGEAGHLLIENVAVAPAFQGRGLGRRLLAQAEAVAVEWGLGALRLYTNQRFAENIRLYESSGYGVEREEAFMEGFTVFMSKRL